MLKIITLDDIVGGEIFLKEVVNAFLDKGLTLTERHAWLHRDNFPRIVDLVINKEGVELGLADPNHEDESKRQPYTRCFIPQPNVGILRAGFAWLYGFGMIQHEYRRLDLFNVQYGPEQETFKKFSKEEVEEYYDLAAEI